jgi:YVTN family beta-propeller protein
MRRLYVLGFVLLLAAGASGQWLENSVWLPDSISGLEGSSQILFNPINHHAYVGGIDAEFLQIVDYSTRAKIGFIDSIHATNMFMCPDRQRVYVGDYDRDAVAALDAATDSVLRIIELGSTPACGVYNGQVHKAYVGTWGDAALFVLDPGPDTLLTAIQLADEVIRIAYDSVTNRVFGMAYDGSTHGIKVIDCAGDSLVGVLPSPDDYCLDLALDPAARRLYCLGQNLTTDLAEVWVYDVDSLALLDTIALPESWAYMDGRLLLNPTAGRLYAGYMSTEGTDDPEDSIAVIDCGTNTITRFIGFEDGSEVRNWALNPADNKVYICTWDLDSVAVLGVPDSITHWVKTGASVSCVGWNPENDELLMADDNDVLSVVSGANDSVVARVSYRSFYAQALRWNPAGDKLYAFGRGVMVIDAQNNVTKQIQGAFFYALAGPAYSPELNRFYLPVYTGVASMAVFDCNRDSFLMTKPMPVGLQYPLFAVPGQHKVYCPYSYDTLAVYDTYSDSVVKLGAGFGVSFVYNPRTGLVYGHDVYVPGIQVIDPNTDSVLQCIDVEPAYALAVNLTDNELYASPSGADELFVVDCETNTVEDTIILPQSALGLHWYEPLDKLYVDGDSAVMVVDCRTRALTGTIPVESGRPFGGVFAERNDKLWVATSDSLWVIRCLTDSVVTRFPGSVTADMVWNPVDNRVYAAGGSLLRVYRDEMTGFEVEAADVPVRFSLRPSSNPAAGAVRFECGLPGAEPGLLRVFDAMGRQVWSGSVAAGDRAVVWPGTDRQGGRVPTGVYLVRLESGKNRSTAKVVLR